MAIELNQGTSRKEMERINRKEMEWTAAVISGLHSISLANSMSSSSSWLNSRKSDGSSNSRIHWKQQGTRHKIPGFKSLFCHFLDE